MKLSPAEVTVSEVASKFPVFHEIGNVITIFKRAHHLSLCWARWISSTPLQLVSV